MCQVIESGFKSVAHYLIKTRHAGNKPVEAEDGTVVVGLTEGEAHAPSNKECSSTFEWCESESKSKSDSDGDVSKLKKHTEQAIENQDDDTEVTSGLADKDEVLQKMIVSGGLEYPLLAGI